MEKQQIMIIEDEKNLAFLMKKALTKRGYEVWSFENEERALEYLHDNIVHLIILDFHLTKIPGEEMVAKIKNKSNIISIIVISGCFSVQIQQVQSIYNVKFLAKPFATSELLAYVAQTL